MNPQYFKAPFLSKSDIWRRADEFRNEVWPSTEIPIDVMSIVEFELDMRFECIRHSGRMMILMHF